MYVNAFACVSVHGKKANDGACFVCAAVAMDFFIRSSASTSSCVYMPSERASKRETEGEEEGE